MSAPRRPRVAAATSAAHEHLDWLKLVEVTGPSLSLDVLTDALPQGLDGDDPEVVALLRSAHDEWREATTGVEPDIAIHRAFVDLVVREVLGFTDAEIHRDAAIAHVVLQVPGRGDRFRPDAVLGELDAPARRMLLAIARPGERLDRLRPDGSAPFSAEERTRQLCLASGIASALVANGRDWTLVHAPPKRTATYARFDMEVLRDERVALRAFRTLLGRDRLLGAADERTLDALLERSKDDERDVTTRLGRQTRRAVELLVEALDHDDRNHDGDLSEAIRRAAPDRVVEEALYEAVVAVVMRLVFLLAAEDRGLFPEDEPWLEGYAVHPMLPALRAADEELLDRGYDAWPRLLASFRAVHGGLAHDALRLPGYGGDLFDRARYPFLEFGTGRRPVRVSNRVVYRVLRELLELEVDVPGGGKQRRPLSYRALGVEQIGHVYEGLLDHTARRADELVLGLAGAKEPEIAVSQLEGFRERGETALIGELKDLTGRTPATLRRAIETQPTLEQVRLAEHVLGHDAGLVEQARPWLPLLPAASDRPVLIRPGQAYVTASDARRSTGTHYTPRSLTEPIVKHALDPLCFDGAAAGKPEGEWRVRSADHILGLKVADIAMGSGAFLVQACRYLGERLVEAWHADPTSRPEGLPDDPAEQLLIAKRRVAERCLYGVDRNPLAVEMAKLSLWLETLQRDRPFTFVDHALRCGDSLVGITSLDQLERLSLSGEARRSLLRADALAAIEARVSEARAARELLEETDDVDLAAVDAKREVLRSASVETLRLRLVADLICGAGLAHAANPRGATPEELIDAHAATVTSILTTAGDPSELRREADTWLDIGRAPGDGVVPRPLHWPLEFPEVFATEGAAGFSAIVGNPPFLGGQNITGTAGTAYRSCVVRVVADGRSGSADLVVYFVLRAAPLLAKSGRAGLITTNTVSQGDSREVGIEHLWRSGWNLARAIRSMEWPGEANLWIAQLWYTRGSGSALAPDLEPSLRAGWERYDLTANASRVWQGSIHNGDGFLLNEEERTLLLDGDQTSSTVVVPFVIADDLTDRPGQGNSRYIIDFRDWELEEARRYPGAFERVSRLVQPARAHRKEPAVRERWWLFERRRGDLYAAISGFDRVLVGPRVAKWWFVCWLPNGWIYSDATNVFAFEDDGHAAVLSSTWHDAWARKWSGSLETRLRYSPTDCFQNFPFPRDVARLEEVGAAYLSHRTETQLRHQQGLTAVYNRAHEQPAEREPDIVRLRELRVALDRAVADAYGWSDLELDHDHREVDLMGNRAVRFTVSDGVRLEVLDRLLELNHERYAEEVAAGLHGGTKHRAGGSRGRRARREGEAQASLELDG